MNCIKLLFHNNRFINHYEFLILHTNNYYNIVSWYLTKHFICLSSQSISNSLAASWGFLFSVFSSCSVNISKAVLCKPGLEQRCKHTLEWPKDTAVNAKSPSFSLDFQLVGNFKIPFLLCSLLNHLYLPEHLGLLAVASWFGFTSPFSLFFRLRRDFQWHKTCKDIISMCLSAAFSTALFFSRCCCSFCPSCKCQWGKKGKK